jgi:DNA-binding LacI/PurR family transcriptional regulator/DNA-binding transcriptional regulator YhcF (GntR family)
MLLTGLAHELRSDRREGGTVYPQVREQLRITLIDGGKPGDRVPSERELARQFAVSPVTIGRALQELQREGLVERIVGKGTFISFPLEKTDSAATKQDKELDNEKHSVALESSGANDERALLSSLELPAPLRNGKLQQALSAQSFVWIVSDFSPDDQKENAQVRWGLRAISSIERLVQKAGGRTVVTNVGAGHHPGPDVETMITRGVNSIIVVGSMFFEREPDFAAKLIQLRMQKKGEAFSVVVIPLGSDSWPLDLVRFDDEAGIFGAVAHLVELGHREIAMLLPDQSFAQRHSWVAKRRSAFETALVAFGAQGHLIWSDATDRSGEPLHEWFGESGAAHFLKQQSERREKELSPITGVVAINDTAALQFIDSLREQDIRIPEAISVVGFDDKPDTSWRGLTTLHVPVEEMGERAVEIALHRLNRPEQEGRLEMVLDPVLVVRETTGPPLPNGKN